MEPIFSMQFSILVFSILIVEKYELAWGAKNAISKSGSSNLSVDKIMETAMILKLLLELWDRYRKVNFVSEQSWYYRTTLCQCYLSAEECASFFYEKGRVKEEMSYGFSSMTTVT